MFVGRRSDSHSIPGCIRQHREIVPHDYRGGRSVRDVVRIDIE
jgi:hypothetical protein